MVESLRGGLFNTRFKLIKLFSYMANHGVILLLIFLSQQVAGQQGALPIGRNYEIYQTLPWKSLPLIDEMWLSKQQDKSPKIISSTVGYNFKTHFVPDKDGQWKTILPGIDSWFLKLRSNDAYGVALVLTGVKLMPGERLYVYNQSDLRGPYTDRNLPYSGILPVDFLKGDEVVIEYDVPAGSKSHGGFVIETVSHAYRNIFAHDSHQSTEARKNGDCYLCLQDDAIDKQRRAVVKLVVQYDSITRFCTGTLVNNTALDNRPYIITAEHCISNQFDADRTVFIFGFEDSDCVTFTNYEDFKIYGAYHRASWFKNDFSLVEMYAKPPLEFHPYYAGWDISDHYLDKVTSVHHPQGGPKKVSLSNGTIRTSDFEDGSSRAANAFWNVTQWDAGVTEGGSSGASLFNKNGDVIGTLSGGSSECGAPYNDYFEKLSTSWEASSDPHHQLKYWLDPAGSGVQRLNGSDPFEGIHTICNTLSNVKPGEQQDLLPYTNGQGYFSGYNTDGIATYAEKFSTADSAMLTGVTLNVGKVNIKSVGGLIVNVHSSKDGLPGVVLADVYVPYSRLHEDSLNYVGFYPYVKLADDFFISYTISYSPQDSFALKQVNWRSDLKNTAFVKRSSAWVPMNAISPNGAGSSLGIKVTVCKHDLSESAPEETSITFYPNPVTTLLIGKLPGSLQGEYQLRVYDLQGRQQPVSYNAYESNVVITTADLSPGIYIVKLLTLQGAYQFRFLKR
jgi:lysyl endopeptidase